MTAACLKLKVLERPRRRSSVANRLPGIISRASWRWPATFVVAEYQQEPQSTISWSLPIALAAQSGQCWKAAWRPRRELLRDNFRVAHHTPCSGGSLVQSVHSTINSHLFKKLGSARPSRLFEWPVKGVIRPESRGAAAKALVTDRG